MQVPKPTEADKVRFRSIVPADSRVEVKPMFGNLGAFVNGNMFAEVSSIIKVPGGPTGALKSPMQRATCS